MIAGPTSLTLIENEDFGPLVGTYYADYDAGTLFDFTGYTAQMMFRVNIADAAPVLTIVPVLGGTAGTFSISLTAAQVSALVAAIPSLSGVWDIVLTSVGGLKTHLFTVSPLILMRSVTR